MKNSCIGGQAVIEGVMMKNKERYAVSVRIPDGSIVTDIKEYHSITEKYKFLSLPFIRGSVNMIESMIVGMRTLTFSANFFEDEEEGGSGNDKNGSGNDKNGKSSSDDSSSKDAGKENGSSDKKEEKKDFMSGWVLAGTLVFSFLLAMLLFMLLPQLVAEGLCKLFGFPVGGKFGAVVEGCMRLIIFIIYIKLITMMDDIKRTFMYHGAEHKSINCLEHGLPLTVENVRKSSKLHKRCGTSFIIFVLIIAIIVLMFIPPITAFSKPVNFLLRFLIRIALLPVIAGISYEFLRLAGSSDNKIINILSKPGFWMQGLTTREPSDDMIEVAINSVEMVFDWRKFLKDNFDVSVDYPEDWVEPKERPLT